MMLSGNKAVAGFLLAVAGALADDIGAAIVTPAPSCGGENPCAPQVSAVPTCATSCIESAASQVGCIGHDYSCHCSKFNDIQNSAVNCVIGACGFGGALQVPGAVSSLCSCVTASPTSPCTDEPVSTTSSEPPIITDVPTCGGNPCSQFVSAVPACATGCIESAASGVGCSNGDYGCQCASSSAIQNTALSCVVSGCGAQALDVLGAVGSMCSCVTASPTTPCPVSTSTTDGITSTSASTAISSTATAKPTPTPACPGNECTFPDPADHECVAGCINAVLPEFGCNEVEDWNCYCNNFRKVSSRAFACAWACGSDVYSAFNNPASQGCTCLLEECPASSSSSSLVSSSSAGESSSTASVSEQPLTSTSTTSISSTITSAPECSQPCAASVSAVPACATACITSVARGLGCGGTDLACQCASASAIQASAGSCVLGACALNDALKVIDAVGSLCSCVSASPITACGASSTTTPTGTTASTITSPDQPPITTTTTTTTSIAAITTSSPSTSTTTSPPENCPQPCAPSVSAIPACARTCIASAASAVGCTDTADLACQCTSAAAIQASAGRCVLGACGLSGALAVVDKVQALCGCVTASGVGVGTGGCAGSSSSLSSSSFASTGFDTETRTVGATTTVCDSGAVSATATAGYTGGCDGGGGGDEGSGGDNGGNGGGSSGGDSGASFSSSPSGGFGGDNGSGSSGNGEGDGGSSSTKSSGGGGSTTTPKPPVETAGASSIVLAWTASLAGVIAVAAALL